ncbi:hypothetical protein ACQ3HE_06755 [Plantibacter auratus]|uniref:hypothetical protein n=1 Tax=Plantibacter auratus TaxID=272914 RepID=UPI003D32992E
MSKAMTLRLSDDLHETLRRQAFDERTTITSIIIAAIESVQPRKGCDVCGQAHVMVSTPGGIRFCENHRPAATEGDNRG